MAKQSIFVEIGAAVSGSFNSTLATVKSQLGQLGASVRTGTGDFTSLNNSIANNENARLAMRGAFQDSLALGASLYSVLRPAIAFDSAFADVRKVVNGTADEMADLNKELVSMGQKSPLGAVGLAQIAAAGGQLGIAREDITSFVDVVQKASVAFDMLPDEAGQAFAVLSNVFEIPLTEMEDLGDAINYLSDNTAAKASGIVASMARIGGVAKTFGLTAQEAAGLADTFIAVGLAPQRASTAIMRLLTVMQTAESATDTQKAAFDAVGISAEEMAAMVEDNPVQAIDTLLKSLGDLEGAERANTLVNMFGLGFSDEIGTVVGALGNFDKAMKISSDSMGRAGSLQKEYTNRNKTTENALLRLKGTWDALAITATRLLLPGISTVAGAMSGLLQPLIWVADTFPILTTVVVGAATGLIALQVASTATGYATVALRGALLALRSGFVGNVAAMTLNNAMLYNTGAAAAVATAGIRALNMAMLFNPIGLAIAATALAVMIWWKPLKAFYTGIASGFSSAFSSIAEGFAPIVAALQPVISTVKELWAAFGWGEDTLTGVGKAGEWFGKVIGYTVLAPLKATELVLKGWLWLFEKLGWVKSGGGAAAAPTASPAASTASPAAGAARAVGRGAAAAAANRGGNVTVNSSPVIQIDASKAGDPEAVKQATREALQDHDADMTSLFRNSLAYE